MEHFQRFDSSRISGWIYCFNKSFKLIIEFESETVLESGISNDNVKWDNNETFWYRQDGQLKISIQKIIRI